MIEPEDVPETADIKNIGLVDKYAVYKRIPVRQTVLGHTVTNYKETPVKGQVFVMKPETDKHARRALELYAQLVEEDGHWALAADLRAWVQTLRNKDLLDAAFNKSQEEPLIPESVKNEAIQRFDLTEPSPKEN